MARRVGAHHIAHHHERAAAQGVLNGIRIGEGIGRIRAHDPDRLDLPLPDGAKEIDGLQAGFPAMRGPFQNACTIPR